MVEAMIRMRDHLPDFLRRRANGQTYREIGLVYNISGARVQQIVTEGQPQARGHYRPRLATVDIQRARDLWHDGYTHSEIAFLLTRPGHSFTNNAIAGMAYRYGFPKRQKLFENKPDATANRPVDSPR